MSLAERPPALSEDVYGNGCEPGWARESLRLVHSLLSTKPGGVGLEWGAGSSTLWLLSGRLASLDSVEHNAATAARVQAVLKAAFPSEELQQRWRLQVIPPAGPVKTFLQAESYAHFFKQYVDAPLPPTRRYNFISVNGMARLAALKRAVELLQPEGGILVLANSQRPQYGLATTIVPAHWRMQTGGDDRGATTVWVSCRRGSC